MKKAMLILAAMGAILACSITAFAATVTSWLQAGDCLASAEGGIHVKAYGYVVIKTTKGGYDLTIQLKGAAPSYTYVVRMAFQPALASFTTSRKGVGQVTIHMTGDPAALGNWIGIWETSGMPDANSCPNPYSRQSLFAAPNPYNPPPPAP